MQNFIKSDVEQVKKLEYLAGFYFGCNLPTDLELKIKKQIKKIQRALGDPTRLTEKKANQHSSYILGFIESGREYDAFAPSISPLKNSAIERERDAFELMMLARQNPYFIPSYAWPSYSEESGD